jgi:hypothetical protein
MNISTRSLCAACLLTLVAPAGRAEDLSDLLRRLPESANAAAIVNVKAVRQLSGRPTGPEASGYEVIAGTLIPPAVDLIVYATHLEPGALESRRTGALIRLNRPVTLDDVVDKVGGQRTTVAGVPVVSSPRRGYYVQLAPDLLAGARQVSRQELARLVQFARTNTKVVLPTYLAEALATDAPLAGAVDMEQMLEPRAVRQRLTLAEATQGLNGEELDTLTSLMCGLKGIRMTVGGRKLDDAEVRLDFAAPVGERGELIKALFLEALGDLGVSLREFHAAKVSVDGQTVKLSVKLTDDGLIRVMSLFLLSTAAPKPSAPDATTSNGGISKEATRRYYVAVSQMLDDLGRATKQATDFEKTTRKTDRGKSAYEQTATWHDRYADRIDALPTEYVDPEVVKFAQSVAARLRVLAYSLRGVVVEVGALGTGLSAAAVGSGGGWFGGSGGSVAIESNVAELRAKQAEIVRQDAKRRLDIWESIQQDRRALVKSVGGRYKLELDGTGR